MARGVNPNAERRAFRKKPSSPKKPPRPQLQMRTSRGLDTNNFAKHHDRLIGNSLEKGQRIFAPSMPFVWVMTDEKIFLVAVAKIQPRLGKFGCRSRVSPRAPAGVAPSQVATVSIRLVKVTLRAGLTEAKQAALSFRDGWVLRVGHCSELGKECNMPIYESYWSPSMPLRLSEARLS